jgi:hypothetical protein
MTTKPSIRIAVLTNPATTRTIYERVNGKGQIAKHAAKRLGIPRQVAKWTEVEAKSWKQATTAVKAGKGVSRRAAR